MIPPESQAEGLVFTVVVSEKGGAERREIFDQSEISVGRVQGNELVLPKGNVSKKHARLLFRDGRFIVTDLNSTNGTYVNRRRISQATIVREGDRIYIGDFVLRIEVPEKGAETGSGRVERDSSADSGLSSNPDPSVVSHYPLERDPDESGSFPEVPGAPRVPSVGGLPSSADAVVATRSAPDASRSERTGPVDSVSAEARAYRLALAALVEHVLADVDATPLDAGSPPPKALETRIDGAIEMHSKTVIGAAGLPEGVDSSTLTTHARAEVLDLGPLRALLEDAVVTEISMPHFDTVVAVREGRSTLVEPPFSSEVTFRRAIARLAAMTGAPLADGERNVRRTMADGGNLSAVVGRPPATESLLVIEKAHDVAATLDGLVRSGTISRAMATFFQACMAVRANLLVAGPRGASTSSLLGALVRASDGHVVAIEGPHSIAGDGIGKNRARAASAEDAAWAIDVASRIPDVRLVVDHLAGSLAARVVDAVGRGSDGVLAGSRLGGLRRALSRLAVDLASDGAVPNVDAGREAIATTFDVVVEIARLRDGRDRVLRVAEVTGCHEGELQVADVFTFTVERQAAGGSVEGTFNASGRVPKIADEMMSRGLPIESSLFTRPPSR